MRDNQNTEGAWLEAISLMAHVGHGDHFGGMQLLRTSTDPEKTIHNLLRMLVVYMRGEDRADLERFLEVSYAAGPPPLHNPFAPAATPAPGDPHPHSAAVPSINSLLREEPATETLTQDMRTALDHHLPSVATASNAHTVAITPAITPTITPQPSLRVWNDSALIFNETAAGQHLRNIEAGSRVTITVVDEESLRGFRFTGVPEVHRSGPVHESAAACASAAGQPSPEVAVLVQLTEIHHLIPDAGAKTR